MGWGSYLQVAGTHNHYLLSSSFFNSEVVGILKPSINNMPLAPSPHGVQGTRPCSPSPPGNEPPGETVVKLMLPHIRVRPFCVVVIIFASRVRGRGFETRQSHNIWCQKCWLVSMPKQGGRGWYDIVNSMANGVGLPDWGIGKQPVMSC